MKNLNFYATVAFACLGGIMANAQSPGNIDNSFGISGGIHTDFVPGAGDIIYDIAVCPDDKIVIAGHTSGAVEDALIVKLNSDASIDTSFGNNGKLLLDLSIGGDEELYNVAVQPDGKIVAVGSMQGFSNTDLAMIRLTANGVLDDTFGPNQSGIVSLDGGGNSDFIYALHIMPDGSILVGGSIDGPNTVDMVVYKFDSQGILDLTFGTGGKSIIDFGGPMELAMSICSMPNGKIVAGGLAQHNGTVKAAVAVLNPNGNLDVTFANSGKFLYNPGDQAALSDVKIAPNNKIICSGYSSDNGDVDGFILSLNPDGTMNNGFSQDGVISVNAGGTVDAFLHHVEVLPDGRILATGDFRETGNYSMYAFICDTAGTPDPVFGVNGAAIHPPFVAPTMFQAICSAVQSNGRILIGGIINGQDFTHVNFFLVGIYNELHDFTSIDEADNSTGVHIYPNPSDSYFMIDQNDGESIQRVELFSTDGRLIQTWNNVTQVYYLPENIRAGNYMARVHTNKYIYSSAVIVSK